MESEQWLHRSLSSSDPATRLGKKFKALGQGPRLAGVSLARAALAAL